MKRLKLSFLLLFLVLIINNCSKDEEVPPVDIQETGFLSLNISIEIEELPAARLAAVNTDDFIVTIHEAATGNEVERFAPFSSAPAEIQLPTGEYFVRATNLEPPANAAFEQPWYFGESEVFNIDKEELKPVDLTCALANYKVSFVYSQNVLDNFTDWSATADLNTTDFLIWPKGETREGYFVGGPLDVEVYLEYTKVFTGELITRTFNTTIDDPQPATLYRINIDASLEDGKIVINIDVDDSFDVIDIDLGDTATPDPDPNTAVIDGEVYALVDAYIDDYAEEDPLETGVNSHFGYSVGFSDAAVVVYTESSGDQYFVGTNGASVKIAFEIYAPNQSSFVNGTFNFIDVNTATLADVDGEYFLSYGEIEFDDDGILPNGDFEDAEYDIIGGTVTFSGTGLNYTVDFSLETSGGLVQGNYTGDFQYLDNQTEVF